MREDSPHPKFACANFDLPARGRWISVFAIAFVLGVAVTMAPQRSGDVWSYAMYGRIVAVHHASPYRHVPDEYPNDPMLRFVSPAWLHTGSVYGPTFVAFSAGVAPLAGDSAIRTRLLYQATAALAVAGALVLVWRRTRSPAAPNTVARLGCSGCRVIDPGNTSSHGLRNSHCSACDDQSGLISDFAGEFRTPDLSIENRRGQACQEIQPK